MRDIHQTAADLLAPGRGILVADEYVDRAIDRAAGSGASRGPCSTSDYLRLALDSWGLESYLTGVLLTQRTFDDTEQLRTLKQYRDGAAPLLFGVRMDASRTGMRDGRPVDLDDARRTLADNRLAGARFAEWRANIDPMTVPRGQVHVDAVALARGAAASQAEGVLPLVTVAMPDLASHSTAVTRAVTANALRELFTELQGMAVDLSALVLRINMVLPGDAHRHQPLPDEVADTTLGVLGETVPPAVAGVAFLSGGQSIGRATTHLAAIVDRAREQSRPWPLTFAFTRALVAESVTAWTCDRESVPQAQRELVQSCRAAAQAVCFSGRAASA
ncbi:MAG TPA: class I fructose-bisphosphate aldolase [Nocardioidaceae bacterium]|nr:class I fructose-bisphosphate aldolase [Nocardioidaceae bacterium]